VSAPAEASATVAVIGLGALGARAARQAATNQAVSRLVLFDVDDKRLEMVHQALEEERTVVVAASSDEVLTPPAAADSPHSAGADVVIIATPHGHVELARDAIRRGIDVVSASDDIDQVQGLLALDPMARELNRTVVVGAGFAPGLSCLLSAHAAARFDRVTEIHVAKAGTGGPACARQHHRALSGSACDWRDGGWVERPGGSGRELCWFPTPIDGRDCYRAALPDTILLVRSFLGVERVTARMAANRRDRLTMKLPMLRPPHAEGGPGGVRVEVRGIRDGASEIHVLGSMDRPGLAGGTVAAVAASALIAGRAGRCGAGGLSELFDPLPLLHDLAGRGVRAATFEGLL